MSGTVAHRAPAGAGTTPDVSVIVVSYNTRDILHRCLARLVEELATVDGEAIVVDNASSDGSADMVAAEFPQVQLDVGQRPVDIRIGSLLLLLLLLLL